MALYSEKVMDHFRNPRNLGVLEDANGVGTVGNAKCGDIMKMYLKIEDGIIQDVKFETFGCGSAIASSSMATELIKGKPVSEAMKLTNARIQVGDVSSASWAQWMCSLNRAGSQGMPWRS